MTSAIFLIAYSSAFFIREIPELPGEFVYLSDMAIAAISVVVIAKLTAASGWARIPIEYFLLFLGFGYVALAGLLLNDVESSVAFAGIRTYFKYIPIFLIPFALWPERIKPAEQMYLLLFVALLQLPISLYQRFLSERAAADFAGEGATTGDFVAGTLTSSSALAIFCASAIVVLGAFYIRRRISLTKAIVIALGLLIPTAIAETKVTPILIAVGGAGLLFLSWREINSRMILALGAAMALLVTVFVASYDQLYSRGASAGYLDVMTDSRYTLDNYNFQGARAKTFAALRERPELISAPAKLTETDADVGRLDSLLVPFHMLWPSEPIRLLFGLGIGNVDSSFGSGGEFRSLKLQLGASSTTFAMLLWETGLLGASLFGLFLILAVRDFARLAKHEGVSGAIGAGAFGFGLIVVVSLLYVNLFHLQELLIAFIYFAGVAASFRAQGVAVRASGSSV